MLEQSFAAAEVASMVDFAVLILDDSGQVISANTMAERLLGLPAQDLLRRCCQVNGAVDGCAEVLDLPPESLGRAWRVMTLANAEGESTVIRGTWVSLDPSVLGRQLSMVILDHHSAPPGIGNLTQGSLNSIAHEVRTPLCSLAGYLDLLDEQYRSVPRAQLGKIVRVLRRNIRWLEQSAESLVTALNILAGRFQVIPRPTRVAQMFEDAAGIVEILAAGKRQCLTLVLPDARGAVWADASRVLQVLTNLLAYAIKNAPDGGRVTLSATESDSYWRIGVSDNSPGTPWWERGCTQPDSGQPAGFLNGSGQVHLAIALANHVIELHGGRMGVANSPESGNTFWFTLPSAPSAMVGGFPTANQVGPPAGPTE